MIKLLCPRCMKTVALPDDFTGRDVTCSSCNNMFPAPTRYTPTVLSGPVADGPSVSPPAATSSAPTLPPTPDGSAPSAARPPVTKFPEPPAMSPEFHADRPAPPPGLVPPLPPSAGPAAAATLPTGYTRSHGIVVSPRVVAWLPAVLLTVTFVCCFFPWVGTYAGGTIVDSQGLWRSISGYPDRNIVQEKLMETPPGWLDKVKSDWELMLPFLLVLLAALVLACAERASKSFDVRKVKPLYRIWPWVHGLTLALAGFALALLLIQEIAGFGLERAAQQVVKEKFAKDRDAAANRPSDLEVIRYNEKLEYEKFNIEHTFWLYLAVTCNLLAVLMILIRIGLIQRGTKPPPQIVILY